MTLVMVHYGQAEAVREQRNQALQVADAPHLERFVQGPPQALPAPKAVWINKPSDAPHGELVP